MTIWGWPQYVMIAMLAFPVAAWPIVRAVGWPKLKEPKYIWMWAGEYIGMTAGKAAIAIVLYMGGFFS